jgi:hypothetical protein
MLPAAWIGSETSELNLPLSDERLGVIADMGENDRRGPVPALM